MCNKLLLEVEYNGQGFSGFQLQPSAPTLQALLENALKIVFRTSQRVPAVCASRTDKGVRAKSQLVIVTIPFHLELSELPQINKSISFLCKPHLSVKTSYLVSKEFKFSTCVLAKTYRYYILNRLAPPTYQKGLVWHYSKALNEELLSYFANEIVGTHDFKAFRGADCNSTSTTKTIFCAAWTRVGELLVFTISGSGFLHKMVRFLVGTMIKCAETKHLPKRGSLFDLILNYKFCAPSSGLCLEGFLLKDGLRLGDFWDGEPEQSVPNWDSKILK